MLRSCAKIGQPITILRKNLSTNNIAAQN